MIEQRKLPRGWNRHHTLYYRRNYESLRDTRQWREHPAMIVPMNVARHNDLHRHTPPLDWLPSQELTRKALEWCFLLDDDQSTISSLDAFTSVRDELRDYHSKNRRSSLGREALRFSEQFSRQLDFMQEIPILNRAS